MLQICKITEKCKINEWGQESCCESFKSRVLPLWATQGLRPARGALACLKGEGPSTAWKWSPVSGLQVYFEWLRTEKSSLRSLQQHPGISEEMKIKHHKAKLGIMILPAISSLISNPHLILGAKKDILFLALRKFQPQSQTSECSEKGSKMGFFGCHC